MRSALLLAVSLMTSFSITGSVCAGEGSATNYTLGSSADCQSNCRGCRLHRLRCGGCGLNRRYDGLDLNFNCNCQGSYNYPVPPQFTYHWPGSTYKQVLMTDYHSPWRFPPIKPYTDEVLIPRGAEVEPPGTLRPVSALEAEPIPVLPAGQIEPMSSMMQRFFR